MMYPYRLAKSDKEFHLKKHPAYFLQTGVISLRHKPIKTHCYGREQDPSEH